jgi:hypothetical protein
MWTNKRHEAYKSRFLSKIVFWSLEINEEIFSKNSQHSSYFSEKSGMLDVIIFLVNIRFASSCLIRFRSVLSPFFQVLDPACLVFTGAL